MAVEFRVEPLPVKFVFGDIAPRIMTSLAARYADEARIEVRHWAMWVFENGCSVPVPTQIDSSTFPIVRACHLLKLTLEEIKRVEMHTLGEADRFIISTVIGQLDEIRTLGPV